MVSVFAGQSAVAPYVESFRHVLSIAAVNGPNSTVISGADDAVRQVTAALEKNGFAVQPLAVSHAFHSPLMEPMLREFEQVAQQVRFNVCRCSGWLKSKISTAPGVGRRLRARDIGLIARAAACAV